MLRTCVSSMVAAVVLLGTAQGFAQSPPPPPPPPPPGGAAPAGPMAPAAPGAGLHITGLGVKLGLVGSKFGGDDARDDLEFRTGFAAGAYGVLGLGGRLSLQGEVLYVQKGAIVPADSNLPTDVTFALDYVEVPAMLRIDIPMSPTSRVFFAGGLALGFLVTHEARGGGDTVTLDDTNSVDIVVPLGGGIEVRSGQLAFTGEVRFDVGVLTVDSTDESQLLNQSVLFLAGVGM